MAPTPPHQSKQARWNAVGDHFRSLRLGLEEHPSCFAVRVPEQ
jgi:hypothetical protein